MRKLTKKTFVLLLAISLAVSVLVYGCIRLFLPYADKNQAKHVLEEKAQQLVEKLRKTERSESESLFLEFIRETGAYAFLLDKQGHQVSMFTFQEIHVQRQSNSNTNDDAIAVRQPFKFAGAESGEEYVLVIQFDASRSEEIARAILKSVPYVAVFAIGLSIVCAWIFSRYTTSPILRINQIAGKMAQLDFSWYCPDVREDEIGMLSKNINELSDKLHAALDELHLRNAGLEDEVKLEKERERRQLLFFSGVSHELKTPIAVVIGQLEGIQAGIGVYKDQRKYLARSVEILQSLNQFIKEILLVSHMDLSVPKGSDVVCLSELSGSLLEEYAGYAEFYSAVLTGEIEKGIYVSGQEGLLKKALGNVVGNAITHSPECAEIIVRLRRIDNGAEFTVINSPAYIPQEHLPHLFEAFYRAEPSTGHGSGLGLYITGMILDTYKVSYVIENTDAGVKFSSVFKGI